MSSRSLASITCIALFTFTVSLAHAQQNGEALNAYEAGSLQDQLELDLTPIPVGMGALFVPALTDATTEPRVLIFSNGQRVASGSVGKRLVLPPGRYKVVHGQGELSTRASKSVEVFEGVTSPVEPFFGAVRISAVDEDGRRLEQNYVIARQDGSFVYPANTTTKENAYQATSTWILAPGDYTLTLGKRADAETNRVTFRVHPGEVLRYRVVVDDDQLIRLDYAEQALVVEPSIWRLSWVIGGDLGFDRTSQQLAAFNGDALRVGVNTRATLGIDTGRHLAAATLNVDESWLSFTPTYGEGLELQKLNDEIGGQLLYNYRLGGLIGPYVRATGRTAAFDTTFKASEDITLTTTDVEGQTTVTQAVQGQRVELFDQFNPLVGQLGAGVGFTLLGNDYVSLSTRAGAAALAAHYNGGRLVVDARGNNYELVELSDKRTLGLEGTIDFKLKLGQTFSVGSNLDVFVPQSQITQSDDFLPLYRWNNSVALSLGKFAALVYDVTWHRDDIQIEQAQFRHGLNVRLQHTLF